jgi:hypothetical protein
VQRVIRRQGCPVALMPGAQRLRQSIHAIAKPSITSAETAT